MRLARGSVFLLFPLVAESSQWPHAPFSTMGRNIVDVYNRTTYWAGVNWPLNDGSMLPEGIEWRSVDDILDFVTQVGFNFIRMGYATEMVNDVYERNGSDVSLHESLVDALGEENGTSICRRISEKNSLWNENTTRFQVWSDIIKKARGRHIFVHPDLHVDRASWCCHDNDGNAWFDDKYFSVQNWTRALEYVANFSRQHDNVVSMSLHNELRRSSLNWLGYNWQTLVGNLTHGAEAIREVNPDILITVGGMNFDFDLSALTAGAPYNSTPCTDCDPSDSEEHFNVTNYPWGNKTVFELHRYNIGNDCEEFEVELYKSGLNAMEVDKPSGCNQTNNCSEAVNIAPVIITEFGENEDAPISDRQKCFRGYLTANNVSWAMWALPGSYRIRSGIQGYNETFGLLNYNWTGWRNSSNIEDWWKPFVNNTLHNITSE